MSRSRKSQNGKYGGSSGLAAPFNTTIPNISGTPQDGQTLTIDFNGAFTGSPTSYAYRWFADDVAIGSATALTFDLTATQVGKTITAGVIASNAIGPSIEAISNSLGPVVAAASVAPANTTLPLITGTARQGYTLTTSDGVWDNNPVPPFAYQAKRSSGGPPSNIAGATNSAYTLVSADIGSTITYTVTATNAAGSTSATSAATASITAAIAPTFGTSPSLSGTAFVGQVLTCDDGSVTADPPAVATRQWKADTVAISGATGASYTTLIGDVGKTITCMVTWTNVGGNASQTTAGIGPITQASPQLDTSVPAPTLSLAVGATTYPPQLYVGRSAQAQVSVQSLRFQADDDPAFGSTLFNLLVSTNDSEAIAKLKMVSALAGITSGTTFFRAREEWNVAGTDKCSNWSNVQGHGDVTAPTVTSSTSQSSAELAPVLQTITFSETSYVVLGGTDAAGIELVGTQPATSIQYRLASNAIADYEDPNYPNHNRVFTVTPTDLSGNVGSATTITFTVNDVDELANSFTFTDVTGATASTAYTSNTITVAGLATGVSAPYTVNGGTISKNGGAFSASAGSVVNTDTLAVKVTSAATLDGSVVNVVLTIGDVLANQVSDTYSVTTTNSLAPPSGSVLYLDASDSATLFQLITAATAVTTASDPVGYWGDKSGASFHLTATGNDGTRPTYQINSGKPCIRFDGSSSFLRRLASLGMYAAGACTIGIAIKSSPAINRALFGSGRTTSNNPEYLPIMSNTGTANQLDSKVQNDTGASQKTNNTNMASSAFDGTAKTVIVTDSGSAFNAYLNGSLAAQSPDNYTRSGTLTLDITGLGAIPRATPTSFFAADVYAIVVYNSVLGSTDLATLHTFLASKL